jgi:hypothetical protein
MPWQNTKSMGNRRVVKNLLALAREYSCCQIVLLISGEIALQTSVGAVCNNDEELVN